MAESHEYSEPVKFDPIPDDGASHEYSEPTKVPAAFNAGGEYSQPDKQSRNSRNNPGSRPVSSNEDGAIYFEYDTNRDSALESQTAKPTAPIVAAVAPKPRKSTKAPTAQFKRDTLATEDSVDIGLYNNVGVSQGTGLDEKDPEGKDFGIPHGKNCCVNVDIRILGCLCAIIVLLVVMILAMIGLVVMQMSINDELRKRMDAIEKSDIPSSPNDLATKEYVDIAISDLKTKVDANADDMSDALNTTAADLRNELNISSNELRDGQNIAITFTELKLRNELNVTATELRSELNVTSTSLETELGEVKATAENASNQNDVLFSKFLQHTHNRRTNGALGCPISYSDEECVAF